MHSARTNRSPLVLVALAALVVFAVLLGDCYAATLTLLPVGNPGNAPDSRIVSVFTRGAVAYRYYLDKYDVTNAQYVEFLNAKASTADPFALYDDRMETFDNGGIARSLSAPYSYSPKAGMENKPVVFVSWFDALRFTNWLTNGQGSGDTESGSYLITNGGLNNGNVTLPTAAQRAAWAGTSLHYLLPSVDEWYKAAYYKGGGTNSGYWSYPIKTNTPPISGPPGSGDMNIAGLNQFALPGPIYLTDVGAYLKPTAFGELDMGGNVAQLTSSASDAFDGMIDVRGGSWHQNPDFTAFNTAGATSPTIGYDDVGFRIMMIPEPASVALAALAAVIGLFACRRDKRRRRLG